MKELKCTECGTTIFLDDQTYERRLDDGKTFYCINGHGQIFSEPRIPELEKRIEYLERRIRNLENRNTSLIHSVNGYKGQLAKLKNQFLAYKKNKEGEDKL